jgi:ATP-dependent DNA ligase
MTVMPDRLEPMAATLTEDRFTGPEWIFERKFDGIRLLAYKRGANVQLFSRNRLPQHLPAVAGAIGALLGGLRFQPPLCRVDLVDDSEPWERARRQGWEGVITKRRGSLYEHRLVGYFDRSDFVFAGKIGTGFDTRMLTELRQRLDTLAIPASPFTRATGLPRLRVHFVRPELVVEASFIEWTGHGKLRHPRLTRVRFANGGDVRRITRTDR